MTDMRCPICLAGFVFNTGSGTGGVTKHFIKMVTPEMMVYHLEAHVDGTIPALKIDLNIVKEEVPRSVTECSAVYGGRSLPQFKGATCTRSPDHDAEHFDWKSKVHWRDRPEVQA